MKSKMDVKQGPNGDQTSARLSISTDTIAWIRELASSICLIPPEDEASMAEFKQYTWNSAICQAIVEISDRLLSNECAVEEPSNRIEFPSASKTDAPVS